MNCVRRRTWHVWHCLLMCCINYMMTMRTMNFRGAIETSALTHGDLTCTSNLPHRAAPAFPAELFLMRASSKEPRGYRNIFRAEVLTRAPSRFSNLASAIRYPVTFAFLSSLPPRCFFFPPPPSPLSPSSGHISKPRPLLLARAEEVSHGRDFSARQKVVKIPRA